MTTPKRWTDTEIRGMLHQAEQAGLNAGRNAIVAPMIINGYAPVEDGVCGFAWVRIKGTGPLANYAKRTGQWYKGYPTGLQRSVFEFNQSMRRKEAYAHAYAEVLRSHGFEAYGDSRMD